MLRFLRARLLLNSGHSRILLLLGAGLLDSGVPGLSGKVTLNVEERQKIDVTFLVTGSQNIFHEIESPILGLKSLYLYKYSCVPTAKSVLAES